MTPFPMPIRVLLVDDALADRELARLALSKADAGMFRITFAVDLTEAAPLLETDEFDVLLLDLGLPESCGMETLKRVREINKSIPTVVLTDLCDEQAALDCLNEGAQDYLLKSHLALETLSRAVRYAIQRQMQHEQLASANALLEQRNEELARLCETAQRFVDNVSHEFRTPLTVITEYVSLLQDGVVGQQELDAEQQRFLSILADRADDLNTMVDDMLDVSKLQAGLLSTWRRNCQLSDVLRHLQPALKCKAQIKEVELAFDFPDDLPPIFCDAEKLGRVLINLAVNAIKFANPPGRVRVFAEYDPAHSEIMISVSDNGNGISQQDQQRIFQRFQQLDTRLQSAQKGFGLGLSIAKELVGLNLGEMSLTSTVGTGSTFSFTVPVADPVEVTRRYIRRLERSDDVASPLALVEVAAEVSESGEADDVDAFLNYVLRPEDLVFRVAPARWVFLVPTLEMSTDAYRSRVETMLASSNRNRPGRPYPPLGITTVGEWQISEAPALLDSLSSLHPVDEVRHA